MSQNPKSDEDNKNAKATKRSTPGSNLLPYESPEARNQSIGYSPELDIEVASAQLEILTNNLDTSKLNYGGTNNQEKVFSDIQSAFKQQRYFEALTIIIREDIQLTPRAQWAFLRLNRVYQGQREGTTDMMETPEAKMSLEHHKKELLNFYPKGNSLQAEVVLENVINGRSGSTETGLDELELTVDMVRHALRAELLKTYPPDIKAAKLGGPESPGQKDQSPIRGSGNPKLNEYLRLYEILTVDLLEKQTEVSEKVTSFKFKREQIMASLNSLAGIPELKVNLPALEKIVTRLKTLDKLNIFELKVEELERDFKEKKITAEQANVEIDGWQFRKFDHKELLDDIEKTKQADKLHDDSELDSLRNQLRNGGSVNLSVHDPEYKPVHPEDIK